MGEQSANAPRDRARQLVSTVPKRLSRAKDAYGSIDLMNDRNPTPMTALIHDAYRDVPETVAVQIRECNLGTYSRSQIVPLPES